MKTTDVQFILDALNQKGYALRDRSLAIDADLTTDERVLLNTYQPDSHLVIYGSLAPGRPNYAVVEPIQGSWQTATISGTLANQGWGADLGYYGFVPTPGPASTLIPTYVLSSNQLVNHWPRLDIFEGPGYQRMLVSFTREDGETGVGYLYALREEAVRATSVPNQSS